MSFPKFIQTNNNRLYGIEVETCTSKQVRAIDANNISAIGLSEDPFYWEPTERTSGMLTTNGGRIFDEVGDHLEYATPECINPLQAILVARAFQEELARSNTKPTVNTRSVGFNEESRYEFFGYHENYSIEPNGNDLESDGRREILDIHLRTRTVFGGPGCVMYGKPKISAKAGIRDMNLYYYFNDYWIYNISSANPYSHRLEVRFGEDQPSTYAQLLKVGSTDLLIRALSYAFERDILEIVTFLERLNPDQIVAANNGVDPNAKVGGRGKSVISMVDVQKKLHELTIKILAKIDYQLSDLDEYVLQEWGTILEQLAKSEVDPSDGRVDWLARLVYWEQNKSRKAKHGATHKDICYSYDTIGGKGHKLDVQNVLRLGWCSDLIDLRAPTSDRAMSRVLDASHRVVSRW